MGEIQFQFWDPWFLVLYNQRLQTPNVVKVEYALSAFPQYIIHACFLREMRMVHPN